MEDRREEIERRRRDLAERRREHDARRKALDERKQLYQQEVQLEEEERRLNEDEERLLREHERLDHLEFGLEYEESGSDSDEDDVEAEDSLPVHAFLIAIGVVVILFAAFSWFDALANIFGIAGFICLAAAIWRAFMDEERSVERLKVFLGGIAFFWAGALLIMLCGAISSIYFSGFFDFLNFLGLFGNGILIVAGLVVCITGFVGVFSQNRHGEVSGE